MYPDAFMPFTEGADPQHWKNLQPATQSEYRAFLKTGSMMGTTDAGVAAVHLHCPANTRTEHSSVFLTTGIFFSRFKPVTKRTSRLWLGVSDQIEKIKCENLQMIPAG